jgi:prepilin-type N-terminal cleavage/methylation domain-containing protein
MRLNRNEAGFTLIELLLVIVILGIIAVPLSGVVLGYLRNSDATTARMTESRDAQFSAAYFAQDVASMGVRSATSPYPLVQSVDDTNAGTWPYPCGTASITTVVRFAWDDYAAPGSATQIRVAYVRDGTELHRLTCAGSATPVSDVVVAHSLNPVSPPVLTCWTTCTSAAVPSRVTMSLSIKDPKNAGAAYVVNLTGQRRQT